MITIAEGVYIGVVFALGGAVHSLTGFGFAIVSALPLAFLFDVRTISLTMLLVVQLLLVSVFYQTMRTTGLKIRWRTVAFPVAGTVVGRFVGIYLLERLPEEILLMLMSWVLLLIAGYFLFLERRVRLPQGLLAGASAGLLSGVFGGLFNFSGPPLVAYFRTATDSPAQFIATLQVSFVAGVAISLGSHLWLGNFTARILALAGTGGVGCIAGSFVGRWLFLKVHPHMFSRVVSYAMVAMTLALVASRFLGR